MHGKRMEAKDCQAKENVGKKMEAKDWTTST